MGFIELTNEGGEQILVRASLVEKITPASKGCGVVLQGRPVGIVVRQSRGQVLAMLQKLDNSTAVTTHQPSMAELAEWRCRTILAAQGEQG